MKIPVQTSRKNYHFLVSRFAPFLYLDAAGDLIIYRCRDDLYYDTLRAIADMFPKGFVNLDLYLYTRCKFRITELAPLYNKARKSKFLTESEFFWDFNNESPEAKVMAQAILQTLHLLTDSAFDFSAFNAAYGNFCNYITLKHEMEKKEK